MTGFEYLEDEGLETFRQEEPRPGGFAVRFSMLSYMRRSAAQLGIPLAIYLEHRQNGEGWCSYHRAWEPGDHFGHLRRRGRVELASVCKEGGADRSRLAYAKRKGGPA